MIKRIDHTKMGFANHGWLKSYHHFSFADYYNPRNINFGVLRVLNDDLVAAGTGFETHPHRDMEIISYVVDGRLTHADSMGNERELGRGQVQYMSAGTGVLHSELNKTDEGLRFLQIWIFPDREGYEPAYGDRQFRMEDRLEKWMPIASGVENDSSAAPIRIHQDVNVYAAVIPAGKRLEFPLADGRQAYFVQIEGSAALSGKSGTVTLETRDAAEITREPFAAEAVAESHVLVLEMASR
jgi:redox-sensitive bicupin YhaK (pirin superfamily)